MYLLEYTLFIISLSVSPYPLMTSLRKSHSSSLSLWCISSPERVPAPFNLAVASSSTTSSSLHCPMRSAIGSPSSSPILFKEWRAILLPSFIFFKNLCLSARDGPLFTRCPCCLVVGEAVWGGAISLDYYSVGEVNCLLRPFWRYFLLLNHCLSRQHLIPYLLPVSTNVGSFTSHKLIGHDS